MFIGRADKPYMGEVSLDDCGRYGGGNRECIVNHDEPKKTGSCFKKDQGAQSAERPATDSVDVEYYTVDRAMNLRKTKNRNESAPEALEAG